MALRGEEASPPTHDPLLGMPGFGFDPWKASKCEGRSTLTIEPFELLQPRRSTFIGLGSFVGTSLLISGIHRGRDLVRLLDAAQPSGWLNTK